jgi:hypothetical protein
MKRHMVAGFGLALGLALLSGCAPPPPDVQMVPVPMPPAPLPPVALVPPPAAPVWVPAVRHHPVRVARPVAHRHWVRRYSSVRTYYTPAWTPRCGSSAHPCDVEHIAVPIQ